MFIKLDLIVREKAMEFNKFVSDYVLQQNAAHCS